MTKVIYRVENEDGSGMYWGGSATARDMYETETRHPAPLSDEALNRCDTVWDFEDFCEQMRFGFRSLAQLKFWIYRKDWRSSLSNEGFNLSVYEVPDEYCRYGDTQAVFDKAQASLVDTIDLSTV